MWATNVANRCSCFESTLSFLGDFQLSCLNSRRWKLDWNNTHFQTCNMLVLWSNLNKTCCWWLSLRFGCCGMKPVCFIHSHDVAAPLTPAFQEVAGYINYSIQFIPHLKWRLVSELDQFHPHCNDLSWDVASVKWWKCIDYVHEV